MARIDGDATSERLASLIESIKDPTVSPKSRAWLISEIEKILTAPNAFSPRQLEYFRKIISQDSGAANQAWERKQTELACPEEPIATSNSESDVITVETELVMAPVRAWTRTSGAVSNLKAEELKLFVNGSPWEVDAVDRGALNYEVVLLLDFSGSMSQMRGEMARAARDFATRLKPGDSMAVLVFANQLVDATRGFQKDPNMIEKMIMEAPSPGDGSMIHQSLATVLRGSASGTGLPTLKRDAARDAVRVIVMLTDGLDSGGLSDDLLELAEESNAMIYPVGFGTRQSSELLTEAARRSGGTSFEAHDSSELVGAYQKIQKDLANLYRVSFKPLASCPKNPLPSQCSIKVRALRQDTVIQGRTNYSCQLLKGN